MQRKHSQFTPANQIVKENGNKLMQELAESSDGVIHSHDEAKQSGFDDKNEEETTNAESKKESTITPSFNDETPSPIKENEEITDTKKKVLVSIISIPIEHIRRDIYTLFQRTKGTGNVFWKLSVDLTTRVAEIEFCGITEQKDVAMTSVPLFTFFKGIIIVVCQIKC
ncbi:MAG: hypothetical protein WA667_00020 [Candidatus Nitrosopolaris sp.]